MTLEKGAMVFHMLRWEVGDDSFRNILKAALKQYADKPIRTSDFSEVAESQSQQQLTAFFAQWIDGTGAPEFNNKYTVYRLGNNKGFERSERSGRTSTFSACRSSCAIETDGKTEIKRIDVVGTDSQYVVDTFGRPRHISLDPNNWLLKNSPDMQVRVSILRGQQLIAQGDTTGALAEYQKALTANPNSSLASYRIGEALFSPAKLPGLRQRVSRRPARRRRSQMDRSLEPHSAGQDLRCNRPARPRRQRIPRGGPDQRQYPGRAQRSPAVPAGTL
jgi:hypothetical protein